MNPFRAPRSRVLIAAGLGLIAVIAAERSVRAGQAEPLLQSTPLVLKDGRIANVSIHVVPFAPGRAELAAEAKARLVELTRAIGTDCFLTAQVIGHIDSSEFAQDDTLNAHRLARSRADAVQASLIGGGLPAKAIASVWDWQFLVHAPRATLWVFQLTAGEDCEGRPLGGGDLVAQAPPSRPQPTTQPQRATAQAPAGPTPGNAAEAPVVARVDKAPPPAQPAVARPKAERDQARATTPGVTQPAPQPERPARAKPAEQRETGAAVVAKPALAPKAAVSGGKAEQPAKQRATESAAAAKPTPATKAPASEAKASDGKAERSADGSLVITFATNSSFFPLGTTRRLRELIKGIDPESRYEVSLQVAISGSTKVVGAKSAQEAARYNKWLAERRLERVQDWLVKNAAADALSIKPEYVTDESRRVVVRLAPVG